MVALSLNQEKAVLLLSLGMPNTEVAEQVSVTRQTIHRWQKQEAFSSRVDLVRKEHLERFQKQTDEIRVDIDQAVLDAQNCIFGLITSADKDAVRLSAAKWTMERYAPVEKDSGDGLTEEEREKLKLQALKDFMAKD